MKRAAIPPTFLLRPSALAVALAFAPVCLLAQTLPTAPSVVQGSATITRPGAGQMNVQQNSQNAVINWQSFSIGANGRVIFNQPNAQSIALNRVTGSDPSAIFGSLSANGRVFLVNPNGVLFGAGASVNVGGLVASTLNIADSDFAAGRYRFTRNNGVAPAGVVNEGSLQAAPGGVIALVGSTADNRGTVSAPQGTAALASGKTVTLDFQGDGLTQLRVTEADLQALAANSGTLAADGGRVLMLADASQATGFVVNQGGIVRARSLSEGPGGVLIAGGGGDVSVTGSIDTRGGAGLRGSDVSVSGRNVGLLDQGRIDAGGDRGGAHVELVATAAGGEGGVVVVARDAQIAVDAGTQGNGGRIDLTGSSTRTLGSLTARGGALAGDGGLVKITVSGGADTSGARVDASAAKGRAGTFNIDPFDVYIVDFNTAAPITPAPVASPFVPVADTFISTRDINATLDAGTNLTITTGAAGAGQGGTIHFGLTPPVVFGAGTVGPNANIVRSVGAAPVTLRFDAARGIVTTPGTTASIRSTAGALNVDFDTNANGPLGGGIQLQNFTLQSNGGNVRMFGGGNPSSPSASFFAGVDLDFVQIDTRVGQSDANAGGNIQIVGQTLGGANSTNVGVGIRSTALSSSSGAIIVRGSSDPNGPYGSGVNVVNSTLDSTSGAITVTGLGQSFFDAETKNGFTATGITVAASAIRSTTGPIDLRGNVLNGGDGANGSVGVRLREDAVVAGGGAVGVAGSTADNGAGVQLEFGSEGNDASISGGHVTIRASNADPASDALVLNGTITSTGITNLRPGAVDANGVVSDRSDVQINLGSAEGLGLSAGELGRINAGTTLVLGSNEYGGQITVRDVTTTANNLTLQTGNGGGIAIDNSLSVGAGTLALVTGGSITQGGAILVPAASVSGRGKPLGAAQPPVQNGSITAGKLLVRAADADLGLAGNSADTLAASMIVGSLPLDRAQEPAPAAPGTLNYGNSKGLVLGAVAAQGVTAGSETALALDATSLNGAVMTVRTYTGNITLAGNITASTLDLVSAGTFQNASNSTITASDRWHLYADTWVGETRGGLAGSGPLPNIYGCNVDVACGITIPANNNVFVYARQPTLTVTVNDQNRVYGDANPTFTFAATGFVNGDTAAGALGGAPTTTANSGSNVGNYAIDGAGVFSPAGYLVTTVNGTLGITPATLTYVANPATRTQEQPNPAFSGTVTGLRNEDSLAGSTTGTLVWTTPATQASAPGNYAINGGGLTATNYVFAQAEGNATALTVTPGGSARALAVLLHELGAGAIEPRREEKTSYVYDRNLGLPQMCVPDSPLDVDAASRSVADLLAVEWSRLRTRPNISNCFDSGRKNACGDF